MPARLFQAAAVGLLTGLRVSEAGDAEVALRELDGERRHGWDGRWRKRRHRKALSAGVADGARAVLDVASVR
jgi:hypothetical protein